MTIHFPDVSHYQTGLSLRGAIAVFAKATQGTGYHDPAYEGFRAQAAALRIPFAAYHWLDTTSAAAQAKNCFGVVGPDVPLMIDDEQSVLNVAHTLAFARAYRSLGGRVVLEYAPRWVWQNSGSPDLRPLAATGLSLVSSSYPAGGYSDAGTGWAAYGGVAPSIWQYTSARVFNGYRVDFNAFRGTVEQLRALLDPGRKAPNIGDDDMVKAISCRGKVFLWYSSGPGLWWIPSDPVAQLIFAQFGLSYPTTTLEALGWTDALITAVFGPEVGTLYPGGVMLSETDVTEIDQAVQQAVPAAETGTPSASASASAD